MGKKNNLGRAIIKDRFASRRTKHSNSSLHTTELDDGYDWNRLNLKSVTEQNTLDEFLSTAELAGTEFIAEKSNVAIVNLENGLVTPAEESRIRQTQDQYRQQLKIPRRPPWDSSTSPEQLDKMERDTFLDWRRSLSKLQEVEGLIMTPYERNLDFWRQLWRVIERSDVVVQIVDARNPLLFRCGDLEAYVQEVDPKKISMILLNKADYLTHDQRVFWASYFDEIGVLTAFWSATEEEERLKLENRFDGNLIDPEQSSTKSEDSYSESDDDSNFHAVNSDSGDEGDGGDDEGWETVEEEDKTASEESLNHSFDSSEQYTVDSDCNKSSKQREISNRAATKTANEVKRKLNEETCDNCAQSESSSSSFTKKKNSPDILTGHQLIELFDSFSVYRSSHCEYTTIGMVGYPNVGKSSTINALLQTKKVSVSATPGHTKHFQTINLTPTVMLCDCPGLVMPSFVSTKADMVVNGILPVDQMRDFVPPVSLVCRDICRDVLETTYGIMLPQPSEDEDQSRCPTAYEFLGAYATIRGFMTHKGIPDYQRAARCVLKDYVTGKLLHCVAPPNVDPIVFEPTQACVKTKKPDKKKHESGVNAVITSQQDAAFFSQIAPRVKSCGVGGVVGFTRTVGYTGQHVSNTDDATAIAAGKPSKRHNNSKKREKVRRITSHLDA